MIRFGIELRALSIAAVCLLVAGCGEPDPSLDGDSEDVEAAEEAAPPASSGAAMSLLDAKVIHWSVVGDYSGEDLILNVSTNGYAPVTDHVKIGFNYTLEGNGGLVGTPTVTDSDTQMGALRNGAEGCRPPTVLGHYEHSTIERIVDGLGGQLAMTVRTDFPAGTVPLVCRGSGDQPSPVRSSTTQVDFIVPGIALLTMGDQLPAGDVAVSPDKRSLIVRRHGWTYVYTPTAVR